MSHPLKEICNKLERSLRLLDEATTGVRKVRHDGDLTRAGWAQATIERLDDPPTIVVLRVGTTPDGTACQIAEAHWAGRDRVHKAYGGTWIDAIVALANNLSTRREP